jgi:pilus assembly protein Flp/PilA
MVSDGKEVRQVLYWPQEEGQGLVEYALILVLVAIVVLTVLSLMGPQVGNMLSRVTSTLYHL